MPSSLMEKYELLNQIGDGTFGSVAKGISKKNGQLVAIKKMKQKYYTWEECVKLPEVDVVRRIHGHPNIVKLREVIRENNELFFVFEYMDGDVLGVIKKGKQSQRPEDAVSSPAIPYPRVKHFMRQILQALAYIHKRGYFHRDLKPENLLVKKDANGEEIVKLGDFGLVKEVRARPPFTDYVSTRWYRAPELLLQDRAYGTPVDIWAAACIMSELITTRPLFPGANEVDQLFKIMTILGSPTEKMWPGGYALAKKIKYNFPRIKGNGLASVLPKHLPAQALDLMNQMLAYDPAARPTAEQCLQHPYFNVGIDESNAPSSAALSKLMDGAQRLQHSPQSSPAALQGVDVQAKASGQQQVEGPNRTAISSANANFSVSSPSKYYMLPLKTKELAGGAQPVPHGPDHANPKPAEGTTSSKPPADNKNMLYNSKFGKNANHTTSPGEETSAQHYNELGFKGLNLANVRAPYGKGSSNSNWQQPSSTQQPQQIKHKPFPTMASPPKKDAPPHRHNSTDVDLDGLMQEFANEVTPMGYSAQKIASPPESSSQRKNDGGASSLLPKQRGSKDLSPRNDPVLALLNNSRYRKSTQPNANDRSHPTQAPHHNNTDHGYPGLGTSGIGANRNPAGARGSMDSGSMPSVGSMPSPLSGQPNVSPSIRAMLAKHRTSGFNFH